jgi:hypothetical protein
MLDSDDFAMEGADLDEYHEYRDRILSSPGRGLLANADEVLKLMRNVGFPVDSFSGLKASLETLIWC